MTEPNKIEKHSPEELKEMRLKMHTFYTDEIKFLKPQAAYYNLIAEIEESKLRRTIALTQSAQMFAGAQAAKEQALSKKDSDGTS